MQSKHAVIEGHKVHYWEGGAGFPILMLHGVGPGTSIMGNFGPVLEPLSQKFQIFAADLIGFGGSERNKNRPFFDVDLWVKQAEGMLALMPPGPVGIVGHSMGGAIALKTTARNERIAKAMTSCTVGAPYAMTEALNDFWTMPTDRAAMRKAMSRMSYSAAGLTDDVIEDRWKLLNQDGYPDYFKELFAEPRQRFIDAAVLSDAEIASIKAQIVMLHGRDDHPCPPDRTTAVLASKLPAADIHLLGLCGHSLPRERTADFLRIATSFFPTA